MYTAHRNVSYLNKYIKISLDKFKNYRRELMAIVLFVKWLMAVLVSLKQYIR